MASGPVRVLLIEDNAGDAGLVEEMVAETSGDRSVEIEVADCLAAGRERLGRGGVDVVLLDLHLPDSVGTATVNAVRAAAREVPIVVLTGSRDEAIAIEAVQAGAQDYLCKGQFEGPMLLRSIRYAIERQRLSAELDRVREEFAAIVAHDLRTPLHAAGLYTQALFRHMQQHHAGDPNREVLFSQARQVLANLGRMNQMVSDLLDAARIELRQVEADQERISAARSTLALVDQVRPTFGARKLSVTVEGQPPDIGVSSRRFDQILGNLLENARKYSPDGSTVRVVVREAQGGTAVSVEDEGAGIAPEEIPRLFDRFYQSRRARERAPRDGLGLGLYIVRGLVEAYRGSISVKSAPGAGSTFTVWFPRAEEEPS